MQAAFVEVCCVRPGSPPQMQAAPKIGATGVHYPILSSAEAVVGEQLLLKQASRG
jgi:hypothetical protein